MGPLPRQRSNNLHETYQLPRVQLITPDDGHSRCPKHVEFPDKIKFWILDASCWLFLRRGIRSDVLPYKLFHWGINVGGVCDVCCILRLKQLLFLQHNAGIRFGNNSFCCSAYHSKLHWRPTWKYVEFFGHRYVVCVYRCACTSMLTKQDICLSGGLGSVK
jgi:hypothetical protein